MEWHRIIRYRILLIIAAFFPWLPASAEAPATLQSLTSIHQLTNADALKHPTVDFEATVTYYRDYEHTLFVQDGASAIYVYSPTEYPFVPGDRLRIRGALKESFRPIIAASEIDLLHHGVPVFPIPVSYSDLADAQLDGVLVTVRGIAKSADIAISSDRFDTRINLQIDGGPVEAYVDNSDAGALAGLLDAQVEMTGVVSGRFGGKMEMTGIVIHVQRMADIKLLKNSSLDPWTLLPKRADKIFAAYRETSLTERVLVQGVLTYYYPGSAVVLQDGARSLWINTHSREKLRIGDRAEAIGFPDPHDGFLRLSDGEIRDTGKFEGISPVSTTWIDLAQSKHVFEIVSIDAQVVAEVREAARDVYILTSEGHIFSAINRHPEQRMLRAVPLTPLKQIPVGSKVRVVGICVVEDSNPYNGAVPVDLMLRSSDDIAVIARPSPVTVANMAKVISILFLIILAAAGWVWTLRRRVRQQTHVIARNAAVESARERRNAQIEQRRSRILEDISGSRPLAEILEQITELVSFQLNDAPCWCEIEGGLRLGQSRTASSGERLGRTDITGGSGAPLGTLFAILGDLSHSPDEEQEAFGTGTRLAALAIEARRLHAELVHRSEYDMLTEVDNRFSLEKKLQDVVARARNDAEMFGLIFVDLDEFKQVNDLYGHRAGDIYLQEVTSRMKRHLRSSDLLARIGGDEFAVLVPEAKSRTDLEEVVSRLRRCFDEPFSVESLAISGSASIGKALYPEDGSTNDSLLSAADSSMYAAKHTHQGQANGGTRMGQ